jgi:hypothetical protein
MSDGPVRAVAFHWPHPKREPWKVTLHFGDVAGRIECVGMTLRSDTGQRAPCPLTTAVLRDLPLSGLIRERRRHLTAAARGEPSKGAPRFGLGARQALRAELPKWSATRGRYTDDHYKAVARVYADAWRRGEDPTRAVWQWAEENGQPISRSGAANWVARARRKGLLAATEERRPGGVKPTAKPRKAQRGKHS